MELIETRQGDTAFLKRCIQSKDSPEGRDLLASVSAAERDELLARRAVRKMIWLTITAVLVFFLSTVWEKNLQQQHHSGWNSE
jgi:hypothetical protein